MERLSSTENQSAMVPVYGNMANLCLICANAQNPEGQPFIDIHGQLGTQLKILDKIHKFLTITIEAGFPLQVCVSCVGKLNVCYELVQLSEKAYEKLVSLREEWEAKKLTDVKEAEPLDDMDDAWSPMDVDVPSPEAQVPVESQDLETDQQPIEESRNKSTENAVEENQLEEYSMLQQPSLLVKGSQIAFVFAEEDAAVKFQYRLSLVLINMDEDSENNKKTITEKVNRVMQFVKERIATNEDQCSEKENGKSKSATPTFDPEFIIIRLGDYGTSMNRKTSKTLQSKFLTVIQRNKWINPDMKLQISQAIKNFISKFKPHQKPKPPKLECDKCGKKMSKQSLKLHMKSKHDPEKMTCCHCNDVYMICDENSHIELHHNGGKNLICKICDSKFNENGEDQPHMIPKSDFPFECTASKCGKAYQSKSNLEKHKQTSHKSMQDAPPYLCDLCGMIYKTKAGLQMHLTNIHFPQVYVCEFCGAKYPRLDSLKRHKIGAHDPKIPCNVCGKLYSTCTMSSHKKTHTDHHTIPCKYCGKLFVSNTNRRMHEQTAHEGVKLNCTLCKDTYFKSVKAMEEHKLKHERGEEIPLPRYLQPAQCSVCSKVFPNSVRVRQHMSIHKREEKIASLPENVRRAHKGRETTIPCVPCLIRFMTQESYDKHVETHHPDGVPIITTSIPKVSEFRFQCRYCDKNFKKKDFCNDHETLHGSGKQHACDFCGKRYSYFADKWYHQNKKCKAAEVARCNKSGQS